MKKLLILIVLIGTKVFGQTHSLLAKRIDSLYNVDQAVQLRFKELNEQNAPADSIQKQAALQKETFIRQTLIIKDIYNTYGYPTISMVGEESSHNYFVMIQHADNDSDFQRQMLPVLEKLSKKGKAVRKDYAYLYDRVQRNRGGKQLYGTQLTFGKNGLFDADNKIVYPPDLADPKHVNARRKSVGLEPIEEYYEKTLEFLGWKKTEPKK